MTESVLQKSREEFEKWAESKAYDLRRCSNPHCKDAANHYREGSGMNAMWHAWQASRSALEPTESFHEVIISRHKALERVEAAEQALREAQAERDAKEKLLKRIADQVDMLPSVTGLSPVKGNYEQIWMAISDLQSNYSDASRARNGMYTKLQAENEKLRELLRRSQSVIDKLLERRGEHSPSCELGEGCCCGMAELITEAESLLQQALSPSPTPAQEPSFPENQRSMTPAEARNLGQYYKQMYRKVPVKREGEA